jgi:hypothetical protein
LHNLGKIIEVKKKKRKKWGRSINYVISSLMDSWHFKGLSIVWATAKFIKKIKFGWRRLNRFYHNFSNPGKSRKLKDPQLCWSSEKCPKKSPTNSQWIYQNFVLWNSITRRNHFEVKKGHLDRVNCYINYQTNSGLEKEILRLFGNGKICALYCMKWKKIPYWW